MPYNDIIGNPVLVSLVSVKFSPASAVPLKPCSREKTFIIFLQLLELNSIFPEVNYTKLELGTFEVVTLNSDRLILISTVGTFTFNLRRNF